MGHDGTASEVARRNRHATISSGDAQARNQRLPCVLGGSKRRESPTLAANAVSSFDERAMQVPDALMEQPVKDGLDPFRPESELASPRFEILPREV